MHWGPGGVYVTAVVMGCMGDIRVFGQIGNCDEVMSGPVMPVPGGKDPAALSPFAWLSAATWGGARQAPQAGAVSFLPISAHLAPLARGLRERLSNVEQAGAERRGGP